MSVENEPDPEIDELVGRAYAADGEEQLALFEEAMRLADARSNLSAGLEVRSQILEAAWHLGYFEKSLIAFNWMLAQCDRRPELWADYEHRLLWLYKWFMEDLHRFPQVTRAQVEQTFADMERRYAAAGHGLRAVFTLRCLAAQEMGEPGRAADYYRQWRDAEPDDMGDCEACELNSYVTYDLVRGDLDAALEQAEPLLAGRKRCAEVPGITQARLLVPLLRGGRVGEAAKAQRASYRQVRETRKFVGLVAQHLAYFALTGQMTKAVKLLEARLGWAMETRLLHDRLLFLLAGRVLFARLAARGKGQVKVNLPPSFPGRSEDGRYDTTELAGRFLEMAREIASAFDARNGNDRFAREVAANEDLIGLPDFEAPAKEG